MGARAYVRRNSSRVSWAWTGIGAVGAAIFGILFFHEPLTAARVLCIGLIVAGIVGLKFIGGGSAA